MHLVMDINKANPPFLWHFGLLGLPLYMKNYSLESCCLFHPNHPIRTLLLHYCHWDPTPLHRFSSSCLIILLQHQDLIIYCHRDPPPPARTFYLLCKIIHHYQQEPSTIIHHYQDSSFPLKNQVQLKKSLLAKNAKWLAKWVIIFNQE